MVKIIQKKPQQILQQLKVHSFDKSSGVIPLASSPDSGIQAGALMWCYQVTGL
jgi:hypothetical protein